jgi:predicted PurR-regulated permease PerM
MALMALLPLVGPWLVWAPAAVWLLLTGQTGRGIVLIVLGLLIVSGGDNVLRPVLIAGRSQLNGLLVLIGVISGVRAMGFLGVVLGPLLLATAVGLLRGYHERLAAETAAAQPSPTG